MAAEVVLMPQNFMEWNFCVGKIDTRFNETFILVIIFAAKF